MRSALMAAALFGQALLPLGALAQNAPAVAVPPLSTTPRPVPPPPPRTGSAPVPSARVLGVPVTAGAPVSPSYDGTAYKTLGGQAETGQDAISGQSMQPLESGRPR